MIVPIKRGVARRLGLRAPRPTLAQYLVEQGLQLPWWQQAWLDSLTEGSLRMKALPDEPTTHQAHNLGGSGVVTHLGSRASCSSPLCVAIERSRDKP